MSDLGGNDIDMPNVPTDSIVNLNHDLAVISKSEVEYEVLFPNRPINSSETFKFHELYQTLFEPLLNNSKKKIRVSVYRHKEQENPHEIRANIIQRFISRWRNEVGNDIFPAFRLILPDCDRDREVYHLKEKKIARLLIDVMKIGSTSDDAHALLNWKDPVRWTTSAGDFAIRCYEVIKKRPMRTTPGRLTITQVNTMLDVLSRTSAEADQLLLFAGFYNLMCADELMWLVRILLKQMKIGATSNTFFHAWHPDADRLFNVSSSLRRVCWDLWNPDFHIEDKTKGVVLMSCFQPQLAQFQKKSIASVVKAMGQPAGGFFVEEKLDGERMQMHYDSGSFRWWSRKAKDYTHLYGSSLENGSLARFLKEAFVEGLESVILDGEMITWDPKGDCIVAFGTLKTAAIETCNNPQDQNQNRPLFRVFDILYLNGKSIIDYDLTTRRQALQAVVTDVSRRIEVHPVKTVDTAEEIETELRKVIATAGEGLVVKNPTHAYRLNDRNDGWIKVKPEYMTGFGESLDCLVIGGYWGSGRRGKVLSSYLCGLRVDGHDLRAGHDTMKFWSFFKVGGGFTANDYTTIAHATDGKWIRWDKQKPPRELIELGGGSRQFERPNMWIRPEDSFVVEVKAASVPPTDQFRMGYTLRFPRFKKLRPDRDWRNALSIQGFLQLRATAAEEAEGKKMDLEVQRVKRVKHTLKIAGDDINVTPAFVTPLPPITTEITPLFTSHAFYVMSESTHHGQRHTKAEIEATLKAHGARILQNESTQPGTHVLGDRRNVKISALSRHATHDIVRPVWAFDCIAMRHILPLEPERHIFAGLPNTLVDAAHNIDHWGEPYFRQTTVEELAKALAAVDIEPTEAGEEEALAVRDDPDLILVAARDGDTSPGWMFKECVVYIDPSVEGCSNLLVRFAGGLVEEEMPGRGGRLTHIVMGTQASTERVRDVRAAMAGWSGKLAQLVREGWVEECIAMQTMVEEERFTWQ